MYVATARKSLLRRLRDALCPSGAHAADAAAIEDYAYEATVEAHILGRTNARHAYCTEMELLTSAWDLLDETTDVSDSVKALQQAAIETRLLRLQLQLQNTDVIIERLKSVRDVMYASNQRARSMREAGDVTELTHNFADHVDATAQQREALSRENQEATARLIDLDTQVRTDTIMARNADAEARLRAEAANEVSHASAGTGGLMGIRSTDAFVALAASSTETGGAPTAPRAGVADIKAILAANRHARGKVPAQKSAQGRGFASDRARPRALLA